MTEDEKYQTLDRVGDTLGILVRRRYQSFGLQYQVDPDFHCESERYDLASFGTREELTRHVIEFAQLSEDAARWSYETLGDPDES
jgi:hypothetical protein